jgi:signal peptidase I
VDFALILLIALVLTGAVMLWDRLLGAGKRTTSEDTGRSTISDAGKIVTNGKSSPSIVVEYARAFFPVILLVFVLRSFVVEPFRIPSGSMLPTLYVGDFILVEKFRYGIRLPIVHKTILPTGSPQRGDVMVFRPPHEPATNYIKRVIGIPGDEIVYDQKHLFINGVLVKLVESEENLIEAGEKQQIYPLEYFAEYVEVIGESSHSILNDHRFPGRRYEFRVPDDKYLVMGDNRDHSNDGRIWGFVPDENIVGRAVFVWLNWNSREIWWKKIDWSRTGHAIP